MIDSVCEVCIFSGGDENDKDTAKDTAKVTVQDTKKVTSSATSIATSEGKSASIFDFILSRPCSKCYKMLDPYYLINGICDGCLDKKLMKDEIRRLIKEKRSGRCSNKF
jgi:hypothetical protein